MRRSALIVLLAVLGSDVSAQEVQRLPNPAYIQLTAQIEAAKEEVAAAVENERNAGVAGPVAAVATALARQRLNELISRLGTTPAYLVPPAAPSPRAVAPRTTTARAWYSGTQLFTSTGLLGSNGIHLQSGYAAGVADTLLLLVAALDAASAEDVLQFFRQQASCLRKHATRDLDDFARFAESQWQESREAAAGALILGACR